MVGGPAVDQAPNPRTMSYRELDERSDQIAARLCSLGVGPESIVGLFNDRCLASVAGILGIFKAGGVYLPLDPEHPADRIAFMTADSGALVIMTRAPFRHMLPDFKGSVVLLDQEGHLEEPQTAHEGALPLVRPRAENLAYVIYTSGSTGRPKGCMTDHYAIARHCHDLVDFYGLRKARVLSIASFNFDGSLEQLLPSLTAGATLIMRDNAVWSGERLEEVIRHYQLDVANMTVVYWLQLLQIWSDFPEKMQDLALKLVTVGSEALPPNGFHLWEELGLKNQLRLFDAYGPTEATITATYYEAVAGKTYDRVPIGKPHTNRAAYILDKAMNPVAVGVRGELFLGEECLARGYLGRPDLTAGRFVPNPFAEFEPDRSEAYAACRRGPGSRLYKTGDEARYLSDGNIEFFGRLDDQVKLRGFRIELGEIEAALLLHDQIREAVVLLRGEDDKKMLVAYYVSTRESVSGEGLLPAGEGLPADDLRRFLKERLPEYMVPSLFAPLGAMPLISRGKINRKALPDIRTAAQEIISPRTPTEEQIARIWQDILELEQVGVTESFFELGGHSLLATRVVAAVLEEFAVQLTLKQFFTTPTIAAIAAWVDEQAASSIEPLQAVAPEHRAAVVSLAQKRLWLVDRLPGASATFNIGSTMRLTGDLNLPVLKQAIGEILRRHESLHTWFPEQDGMPMVRSDAGREPVLRFLDLSEDSDSSQQLVDLLKQDGLARFDMENGPLVRFLLIRQAPQQHVLSIKMHHIISDGWSNGILSGEIGHLYRALSENPQQPVDEVLPRPAFQYGDFVAWQDRFMQGAEAAAQLKYWRDKLSGAPRSHRPAHRSAETCCSSLRGRRADLCRGCAAHLALAGPGRGNRGHHVHVARGRFLPAAVPLQRR